jgi:hypothetical protein
LSRPRVERELLLASSVERPLSGSGRVVQRVLMELASQIQNGRQENQDAELRLPRVARLRGGRPTVGTLSAGNAPVQDMSAGQRV